jgi:hypothetical protein
MNSSTLRNLGIVLFALIAILVGLELADRPATVSTGAPLFAELRDRINDINRLEIDGAGQESVVILSRGGDWSVENRGGYPADIAKVREVLLDLADARILEQKTASPDRYEALGVRDPEIEGSEGVRLTASGDGVSFAVIIGKANQGSNRYVRVADQATSVLIDSNPSLPDSISGWLDQAIVDIPASDVRAATIAHADGEVIRVSKAVREDADFSVPDLPEGRELSYPTVANSIGGALNDLTLEDVRPASGAEAGTTVEFTTFDGLGITAAVYAGGDETWISLAAAVADAAAGAEAEAPGEGADADAETASGDPAVEADSINARVEGWEFRVPSFKANQLTRRWDDILKPVDSGEE